ncbi:MAG TPA: non-ribosomal peptide synthetase [Rhizomicrobium sp.]|jgi:amino acid adenylation domain-containing protein|nr:non-ribosomal peptide synthetase [Rhizomicrobium sp.]
MHQYFASPWLKPSDRALDWHGPVARAFVPFPHADLERPITALFETVARDHADRIALDDGHVRLTYRETLHAVRHLARRIASETKAKELIGILLAPHVDFPIAMLACLAAGRPFVPLDLHYPARWIADVTEDAHMAAIIGRFDNAETDAAVPHSLRRIEMDVDTHETPVSHFAPVGPDEPALVLYTSGSTGKPKGIVNSQRALLRRVEQYINAAHINADDRFMPLSSDCTIAGLRERLTALLTGAALHLIDTQRAGARVILNRLHKDEITICYAVPALLRSLIQLDSKTPLHLRVIRVGGDAVLWSDVELLRGWLSPECLIELGYSSTEAPIMQWFVPRDFSQDGARVPIGYPLPGNALAILSDDGKPAAPGEAGELVIRSPCVALGRWIDGHCVADDFPSDPEDNSTRILRTGDLVRLREDGLIDLIGRKDRQIKIRGQRIEPGEIEAALRRNAGVRDAAIFPRRVGESWWLIAYIVSGVANDSEEDLKAYLKDTLPPSLQPQRLYFVEEIPRLPSAKLNTKALEALDEINKGNERDALVAEPNISHEASETENIVATIWKRLLDLPAIDREANFFDLGGDSLLTLNMMFEIEEVLDIELPVTMIYQTPTIASLSEAIEQHAEYKFSPLVPIRSGEGPPLFIVHGVGGNVMELFGFGKHIETRVYAIQARGLDGREEPNHSIAEMAAYYLSAIRVMQPNGPYNLAGYSSGGLIACEMAQQLKANGTNAQSLTLIDTQTNARQWPLAVWFDVLRRRGHHHRAAIRLLSTKEKIIYGAKIAASFYGRILWRLGLGKADISAPTEIRIPTALQKVFQATLEAVANYRPKRYDGEVLLCVSQLGNPMMAEPQKIWRRYVRKLDVQIIPGDHRTMIEGENGKVLADVLSAHLKRAQARSG